MVDEIITEKQGKNGKEYFYGKTKIYTYKETLEDFIDVQLEKMQDCIDIALEKIDDDRGSDRELFILETVFDKFRDDLLRFVKDINEQHGIIALIKAGVPRAQEAGVSIDRHKTLGSEFTPAEVTT